MDGVAVKPLTVSFAEPPFLTKLNQEHQFDFWYQLSTQERQQIGSPWGPANPQALNRYSYVLNNPLRYTDPSGHTLYLTNDQANRLAEDLDWIAEELDAWSFMSGAAGGLSGLIEKILEKAAAIPGGTHAFVASFLGGLALVTAGGISLDAFWLSHKLKWFAKQIRDHNGPDGMAIATDDNGVYFLNRSTGEAHYWKVESWDLTGVAIFRELPSSTRLGQANGDPSWRKNYHFRADVK